MTNPHTFDDEPDNTLLTDAPDTDLLDGFWGQDTAELEDAAISASAQDLSELEEAARALERLLGAPETSEQVTETKLDFLDSLLEESLQATKTRDRLTQLKTKSRHRLLSDAEQQELRLLDLRTTWTPEANVRLFHKHTCTVTGQSLTLFHGLMVLQRHKHNATATRMIAVPHPDPKLPTRDIVHQGESGVSIEAMEAENKPGATT